MLSTHHQLRPIGKRRDRIKVHFAHGVVRVPSPNILKLYPSREKTIFIPFPKKVKDTPSGLPIPLEQDDFSRFIQTKIRKARRNEGGKTPKKQSKNQPSCESEGTRGRRTTIACTVNHPSTLLVGSQIEEKKRTCFSSPLPELTRIRMDSHPWQALKAAKSFQLRPRPKFY